MISEWKKIGELPSARSGHTALIHDDYLYITGGRTNENKNFLNEVLFTKIDQNGDIEEWQSSEPLPFKLRGHCAVTAGEKIYLFGGYDNHDTYETVLTADFKRDGSIENWNLSIPFTGKRDNHTVHLYNNKFYIIGGQRFNRYRDDILSIPVEDIDNITN